MRTDNIRQRAMPCWAAFRLLRRTVALVLAWIMLFSGFIGDGITAYAAEEKTVKWLDAKTYFGSKLWTDDVVSCKVTDGATKVQYFNYSGTIKPESEELLKTYLAALEAEPYNLKLTYQDDGVYCYHAPDSGLQPLKSSKTGDHLLYISLKRTSVSIKIEIRVQAEVKWDKLAAEQVKSSGKLDTVDIETPTQAATEPPTEPPAEKIENAVSLPAPDHFMGVDFQPRKVSNARLFILPNEFRFGFKEYPKTYVDDYLKLLTETYGLHIMSQSVTDQDISYLLSYEGEYVMSIQWDAEDLVLSVGYKDRCDMKNLDTWAERNAAQTSGSGGGTGSKTGSGGTKNNSGSGGNSGSADNQFTKRENNFRCTRCGGDGERSCSRCGGAGGKYTYSNSTANFSGKRGGAKTVRTWERCSKCHGSGSMKCTNCGGDGVR